MNNNNRLGEFYESFGCKCRYEYYSLEWLLLFDFSYNNTLRISLLIISEMY